MLYAVYEKCPVFGGKVESGQPRRDRRRCPACARPSWSRARTRRSTACMAASRSSPTAGGPPQSARKKLKVTWDEGPTADAEQRGFATRAPELAGQPPASRSRDDGDADAALAGAAKVVEAAYSYPFIAHAPLEPQNCTAQFKDGKLEIWAPTPEPADRARSSWPRRWASRRATSPSTCSRRRRLRPAADQRLHGRGRLDRQGSGACRSSCCGRAKTTCSTTSTARAASTTSGRGRRGGPAGRLARPLRHLRRRRAASRSTAGISPQRVPGRLRPNFGFHASLMPLGVPDGRAAGAGSNAFCFVFQSFIDELAHAAGKDPCVPARAARRGRRAARRPSADGFNAGAHAGRARAACAEKSGWGRQQMPRGVGMGVAFHFSHRGYFAEVARVRVDAAARDEGREGVGRGRRRQSRSSTRAPRSTRCRARHRRHGAADVQEITFDGGRTMQSNFHDYPLVRIAQAPPEIEVRLREVRQPADRLGEPALPPVSRRLQRALCGHRQALPLVTAGQAWILVGVSAATLRQFYRKAELGHPAGVTGYGGDEGRASADARPLRRRRDGRGRLVRRHAAASCARLGSRRLRA